MGPSAILARLGSMGVGARLYCGFALVQALLILVTILGISCMDQMQQGIERITGINNVKVGLATGLRDSVFERMIALRNMALVSSASESGPQAALVVAQGLRYADAQARLRRLHDTTAGASSAELALFDQIERQERLALPLMRHVSELARLNLSDQMFELLITELAPVQHEWMRALDQLIAFEERQSVAAALTARQAYEHAWKLMAGIGALAVLAGIGLSFLITRGLLRQLGGEPTQAVAIAGKIAAGQLAAEIGERRAARHEGSVIAAMGTMRSWLVDIVRKVRNGTDAIAQASAQIAAGNQELSVRTQDQHRSLADVVASIARLTAAVRINAVHALSADQLAAMASEAAIRGGGAVARVVDMMAQMRRSADRIADIVGVIDGIAFQINLLALNASVEAARAGPHGRGFAVVASEVRDLAQRSALAATEIKTLIGQAVANIKDGNELAGSAGSTIGEVVARVGKMTDIMSEIVAAGTQQSQGIDQVSKAVAWMEGATHSNAMQVDQVAAAANSLRDQAEELSRLVSIFSVPDDGGALVTSGRRA